MAVGVAEIDIERMARAVPAGSALDARAEAERAGDVAGAQDADAFRRGESNMVQPRAGAFEEHDVVRVALALQEHAGQLLALRHDVFAQPEAGRHVELGRLAHVGREDLIVVDPMRGAAAMQMELREHAWHHRHGRAELQRHAGHILRVQRLALMRNVGPGRRAAFALKERLQMIEIVLAKHPHADACAGRRIAGAPQHQAVMTGFLDAAQIDRVAILLGHDKADHLGVEQPAASRSLTVRIAWLQRVMSNGAS